MTPDDLRLIEALVKGMIGGFLLGLTTFGVFWYIWLRPLDQRQTLKGGMSRKAHKARRREFNTGGFIVNDIKSSYLYPTGMYEVKGEHLPWGQGFVITLKHYSKEWLNPLVITVDFSDLNRQPLKIEYGIGDKMYHTDPEDAVGVATGWMRLHSM